MARPHRAQPEGLRSVDMGVFLDRARSANVQGKQLELLAFLTENWPRLSALTALL
jgi:hypothetical protein